MQEYFVEQIVLAAKLVAENNAPLTNLIEKSKYFLGKDGNYYANEELELLILGNIMYQEKNIS